MKTLEEDLSDLRRLQVGAMELPVVHVVLEEAVTRFEKEVFEDSFVLHDV